MKKTGEMKLCLNCRNEFYIPQYLIDSGRRKYCSRKCFIDHKSSESTCELCGNKMRVENNRKLSGRGRFCSAECRSVGIFTEEVRKKMSKSRAGKPNPRIAGKNSHFWKGGVTPQNKSIRMSSPYRMWRTSVFERDDYTCQKTGVKGGKLEVHHIKNFADYPELIFSMDNGITLSVKSHKEFHKKYGNKNNTQEQLDEFLNS